MRRSSNVTFKQSNCRGNLRSESLSFDDFEFGFGMLGKGIALV